MSKPLNAAIQHFQDGRLEAAEHACNEALQHNARDFHALHLMGVLKSKIGRVDEAVALLEQALTIKPDLTEARFNLGIGYRDQEKHEKAIEVFTRVKDSWPNRANVWTELALCLSRTGRTDDALNAYKAAISIDGESPQILASMAQLYVRGGNFEKAGTTLLKSLDLDPTYVPGHVNLAMLRLDQGRLDDALKIYKNAIETVGDDPEVLKRYALNLLTVENFRDGWSIYGRRGQWPNTQTSHGQCQAPYWNGEDLTDRSLLVWTEQGPGDEILIASMLPELRRRVRRLVLACSARMEPIFKRSFPWCDIAVRNETILPESCLQGIDWRASLTELGAVLRKGIDDLPKRKSFLTNDVSATQRLRSTYSANSPDKHLIGISWRSKSAEAEQQKSAALDKWGKILSKENCNFISLQYGDVDEEIQQAEEKFGINILVDKTINPLMDMDGFVAQTAAMDLVISTTNTTVHVAGSLGVPVCALLPMGTGCPWYWFQLRSGSPWYESVQLFRQSSAGDWSLPLKQASNELEQWLSR